MAKLSIDCITFKSLAVCLTTGTYSIKQIVELTGLHQTTVCRYLSTLHQGPDNLIYIESYKRLTRFGPPTAFWSWGFKQYDAPKLLPKPKTVKEKERRYRKRAEAGLPKLVQTPTGVIHDAGIRIEGGKGFRERIRVAKHANGVPFKPGHRKHNDPTDPNSSDEGSGNLP